MKDRSKQLLGGILLSSAILAQPVAAFTRPEAGVYRSDGSSSDTQAAIRAASDGEVVEIPPGEYAWKQSVYTLGKAITIQGAGSGSIEGASYTSNTIGKGARIFETNPGLGFEAGQDIRIIYTPHGDRYMEGTVTSYTGSRLEVDVTKACGKGTYAFWSLVLPGETRIINNLSKNGAILLDQSTKAITRIRGIHFIAGRGNNWSTAHVTVHEKRGGKKFRITRCRFSTNGAIGGAIEVKTVGGLIDTCWFDQGFDAGPGNGIGNDDQAIGFKAEATEISWRTASTMGTKDVDGMSNTYVENCRFVGFWTQCLDFDDNSRTVVRHCIFDNSGCASHGADTSHFGNRHFELYDNEFIFTDVGLDTFNVTWLLFLRGGTGVIADNVMPNLNSQSWNDKAEFSFTVMNLHRRAGPYACWKGGWPAPHQIGQGHDGKQTILDPVYIWGNTGGVVQDPGISGYYENQCGGDVQDPADYLQLGRDFVVGTPKPGYEKFPYPHPLRSTPES